MKRALTKHKLIKIQFGQTDNFGKLKSGVE